MTDTPTDETSTHVANPILPLAGIAVVVVLGRPSLGEVSVRLLVWAMIAVAYTFLALTVPTRSRLLSHAPLLVLVPGVALLSWPLAILGWYLALVLGVFMLGYGLRVRGLAFGDLLIVGSASLLVGRGPIWGYGGALLCLIVTLPAIARRPSGR